MKSKATKTSKSNRQIDSLLLSGEWAVDFQYGTQMLNRYLQQVALVESGVPFSELGFSKMRENSKPVILNSKGALIDFPFNSESGVQEIPKGSIAKLSLDGMMTVNDGMSHYGIKSMANDIRSANANPNIDGILLEVYSGGGESMSGQILKNAIEDSKIPVVSLIHFSGSAAVWGTLSSTEIIASGSGSRIGSIGAYYTLDKKFLEYYKENFIEIYSELSDDKNKDFREAQQGNFEPFRESATKMDETFMAEVANGLKLKGSKKQINETLRGGMFAAQDAKNRGLVHSIGTMNYAIKRLNSYINFNKKNR